MKPEPEDFADDDLNFPNELLAAWPAAPPPPGLADRVLARRQTATTNLEPEDRPVMQPTPLRHPSERSLLMPVALGFGVAAAMLLAFYLGRGSAPPPVATPATPSIELNVAAPAAPLPPQVPAQNTGLDREPQEEEAAPTDNNDPSAPVETESKAKPSARKGSKQRGRTSADLKNPFEDDDSPPSRKATPPNSGSGAAKDPFGAGTPKKQNKSADLEDPFEPERGVVRIGTNPGVPPARVEIDGNNHGKTPLARVWLAPGTHTVVFHWADGSSATKKVEVKSGQSHIVRGQP